MEEDYLSTKDPGPELKPMSLDMHSAPTCFDKVRVILATMQGCTGIPLTYVICLRLKPLHWMDKSCFGQPKSKFGLINKELVFRAPIIAVGAVLHKTVPVLCKQSGLSVSNQMLPNGYKSLCVL
jgi:hypothetical protein